LYIGWLGAKALWAAYRGGDTHLDLSRATSLGAAFRDGFAVQLSNPKAVIFFSAVLPPFVDPGRSPLPQILILRATTVLMDVMTMTGYGLAGGALAAALEQSGPKRAFSLFVGVLLTAAALFIVLRR